MVKKNALNKAVLWLVSIGSLNWLLLSLADFNIITTITDATGTPGVATFLQVLVGAAGAWLGILVLMKRVSIR